MPFFPCCWSQNLKALCKLMLKEFNAAGLLRGTVMISVPEHGFSRSSLCHPWRTASGGRLLKIICVIETLLWIWPLVFSLRQMSSKSYTRSETDLFLTICFPALACSWGGFLYSVIAVFFPLDQMLLGKLISHRSLLWWVQQSVNTPQDSCSRFVESRCYLSCLNISDSHLGVFAKLAFSVELQNGSLQWSLWFIAALNSPQAHQVLQ